MKTNRVIIKFTKSEISEKGKDERKNAKSKQKHFEWIQKIMLFI